MSSQMVRWGGLAGLAAAVVFLVAAIVNLISPYQRGTFDSFSDYLYQLLVTVAFALIAVAIAGLYALQSGRWGTAGASMAFVGYAIIVVVAAATLLAGADVLLSVRFVGAAAILVGSIVLGLMTIRARILPWWCGALIIVGFPLGDFSNAVIRGARGSCSPSCGGWWAGRCCREVARQRSNPRARAELPRILFTRSQVHGPFLDTPVNDLFLGIAFVTLVVFLLHYRARSPTQGKRERDNATAP